MPRKDYISKSAKDLLAAKGVEELNPSYTEANFKEPARKSYNNALRSAVKEMLPEYRAFGDNEDANESNEDRLGRMMAGIEESKGDSSLIQGKGKFGDYLNKASQMVRASIDPIDKETGMPNVDMPVNAMLPIVWKGAKEGEKLDKVRRIYRSRFGWAPGDTSKLWRFQREEVPLGEGIEAITSKGGRGGVFGFKAGTEQTWPDVTAQAKTSEYNNAGSLGGSNLVGGEIELENPLIVRSKRIGAQAIQDLRGKKNYGEITKEFVGDRSDTDYDLVAKKGGLNRVEQREVQTGSPERQWPWEERIGSKLASDQGFDAILEAPPSSYESGMRSTYDPKGMYVGDEHILSRVKTPRKQDVENPDEVYNLQELFPVQSPDRRAKEIQIPGKKFTPEHHDIESIKQSVNYTFKQFQNSLKQPVVETRNLQDSLTDLEQQLYSTFGKESNKVANYFDPIREDLHKYSEEKIYFPVSFGEFRNQLAEGFQFQQEGLKDTLERLNKQLAFTSSPTVINWRKADIQNAQRQADELISSQQRINDFLNEMEKLKASGINLSDHKKQLDIMAKERGYYDINDFFYKLPRYANYKYIQAPSVMNILPQDKVPIIEEKINNLNNFIQQNYLTPSKQQFDNVPKTKPSNWSYAESAASRDNKQNWIDRGYKPNRKNKKVKITLDDIDPVLPIDDPYKDLYKEFDDAILEDFK